jgi:hypothetical protein
LQFGGRTATAAGAIILKPAGNFPPPFRLDSQVSFGLSDHSARKRRAPRGAQRGVAETADIGRIAVNGAAMLTSFYHRSVLRCGRLAERKSGVAAILSAQRRREKICIDLSLSGYPRQPGGFYLQSIASESGQNRLTVTGPGSTFTLYVSSDSWSPPESL